MKVLLTAVNAKYIHSNLAVYDLRAYAEAYGTGGAQVEIGEYTINHTIDYILEGIYKATRSVPKCRSGSEARKCLMRRRRF